MKENIFTSEFLDEIGFQLDIKHPDSYPQYGHAIDKRTKGMTHIYWNLEGYSMTYFGEKLEPNIGLSIRKDGDTRYVFNGYIYNQEDVRRLLKLTW